MLRLMLLPAIVGILFVGGVYWLRLDLNAAGGTPEQARLVEVHLLPRPDPLSIPVNQAPQSEAVAPPSKANGPTETPAAISNQALAALPAEEAAASEPPMPSAGFKATSDPVPSSAKVTFRTELLRHITRFQRYPRAAERQHMQGTVRTEFLMDREGKVISVWVRTSSGQPILDHAAIDTIRRAQPLPPIPPSSAGFP
ncbi:energy transducer TonB [Bradyrhizobium sp. NAS80.1]|uniref:energy transducer TonB n=1 Tax=Bradyrhizobium sp. NAS80.1 TaxID=1680159 RepID=UPI0011612BD7|nr:energy transducer TonB [Bradyrhizobium sp. NAS80.1]